MPSPTSRAGLSNGPSSSGSPVYLFTGREPLAKDARIRELKRALIAGPSQDFNVDNLYAKDITLRELQECLQSLPVNNACRLVIVRDAAHLKNDCKDYLAAYVQKPYPGVVLIIDLEPQEKRDSFAAQLQRWCRVERFKEDERIDTFALCRQIELGRCDAAVRLLHRLLNGGEKPERIMGGMRYAWEKGAHSARAGRMRALLACDREIKTGLLQPVFALEKLIVGLCGFQRR